jgi:superkiller protein 3
MRHDARRAGALDDDPHRGRSSRTAPLLSVCIVWGTMGMAFALPRQASPKTAPALAGQVTPQAREFILQGFELLGQHNAVEAEKVFRQAIEAQPEAEPAHRGLGLALREQGRLAEAFRELQTATQLDPSDADAHYSLGTVAWTLSVTESSSPGKAGALGASDYQNLAGAEFSRALALSPKDATLRMNLAMLYLDSDRAREARQQAEEAVRIAPDSAPAHLVLGRADFAGGEEDKAAQEFEAAVKLDPHDGGAYLALGQLRLFQHRLPQAEEALRRAIEISPNLGPANAALAQILATQGKTSQARSLLEKSVNLDPQDWQSQYQLAVLLNQAGESARATELLEKVLRANPDFPGAREQMAASMLRRGDAKGATSLAESMIAKDPPGPEGHRIMALALWKQRDYEGSLAEAALALAPDPDSSSMLTLQAIALWQLGRKKDSQMAFRAAAKVEPQVTSADVFCRLMLCDQHDIAMVSEFLHKNRWVLAPPPEP